MSQYFMLMSFNDFPLLDYLKNKKKDLFGDIKSLKSPKSSSAWIRDSIQTEDLV